MGRPILTLFDITTTHLQWQIINHWKFLNQPNEPKHKQILKISKGECFSLNEHKIVYMFLFNQRHKIGNLKIIIWTNLIFCLL